MELSDLQPELLHMGLQASLMDLHLLHQSPALLQLHPALLELGLKVSGLAARVIQVQLGPVQLDPALLSARRHLLQLLLGLQKLGTELLLGEAHGGGNFEKLPSALLQGLQLGGADGMTVVDILKVCSIKKQEIKEDQNCDEEVMTEKTVSYMKTLSYIKTGS